PQADSETGPVKLFEAVSRVGKISCSQSPLVTVPAAGAEVCRDATAAAPLAYWNSIDSSPNSRAERNEKLPLSPDVGVVTNPTWCRSPAASPVAAVTSTETTCGFPSDRLNVVLVYTAVWSMPLPVTR